MVTKWTSASCQKSVLAKMSSYRCAVMMAKRTTMHVRLIVQVLWLHQPASAKRLAHALMITAQCVVPTGLHMATHVKQSVLV